MGSSRLPGKTMMEIREGLPLLGLVVQRFRKCQNVDEICVATSVSPKDDVIAEYCEKNGIFYSRGSEDDVLSRVVQAAAPFSPEAIVQMGADSGYLDFELIDRLIEVYFREQGRYDYVCNDLKRTFPIGIYGHIVKFSSLAAIPGRPNVTAQEREDVVRYFWNHSDTYRLLNVNVIPPYEHPELRLTIDYPEDMQLLKSVLSKIGRLDFTFRDVLEMRQLYSDEFSPVDRLVQRSMPVANQIRFEDGEFEGR
jgi:spore coat polysaccharide biosynthesis protein SpsF